MITLLKSLPCLCGQHDPMRDRSGSVLIYRCQWCLQDLGPILKKEMRVATNAHGGRESLGTAATDAAIARRIV